MAFGDESGNNDGVISDFGKLPRPIFSGGQARSVQDEVVLVWVVGGGGLELLDIRAMA